MVPISYKQFWGLNGTNPVKCLVQYLKHTKLLTSGSNLAYHKSQFSQFLKHLTLGIKCLLQAPLPSMASTILISSGFPLTNLTALFPFKMLMALPPPTSSVLLCPKILFLTFYFSLSISPYMKMKKKCVLNLGTRLLQIHSHTHHLFFRTGVPQDLSIFVTDLALL